MWWGLLFCPCEILSAEREGGGERGGGRGRERERGGEGEREGGKREREGGGERERGGGRERERERVRERERDVGMSRLRLWKGVEGCVSVSGYLIMRDIH